MKAQKPKRLTRAELSELRRVAEHVRYDEFGWSVYTEDWLVNEAGIDIADAPFIVKATPDAVILLIAELEAHRAAERAERKAERGKR